MQYLGKESGGHESLGMYRGLYHGRSGVAKNFLSVFNLRAVAYEKFQGKMEVGPF